MIIVNAIDKNSLTYEAVWFYVLVCVCGNKSLFAITFCQTENILTIFFFFPLHSCSSAASVLVWTQFSGCTCAEHSTSIHAHTTVYQQQDEYFKFVMLVTLKVKGHDTNVRVIFFYLCDITMSAFMYRNRYAR